MASTTLTFLLILISVFAAALGSSVACRAERHAGGGSPSCPEIRAAADWTLPIEVIRLPDNRMGDIHNIRLQQLHGQLGQVVYEMTRNQFGHVPSPEVWQPAINAYRCETSITVCVELAGVDRKMIDLRVEPLRLSLRGRRQPPEPCREEQRQQQILAMEIDYGSFERNLILPIEVEPGGVTAEQRNGLLWIVLPIRSAA